MASLPTGATLPLSSIPPPSALGSVPTFTATTPGTTPPLGSGTTPPSLSSLLATVMSATPATLGIKAAKPLAYSPVLPPIPAKAVEKIRAGSYIDLKELLADNIALSERYQELGHPLLPNAQAAPKLRSITDPLTWVFCFLSYMAAATECDATRDMAAYAQIVIQQARKHPGPGWLAYDQLFRQRVRRYRGTIWPRRLWPPPSFALVTHVPCVTSLTTQLSSAPCSQSVLPATLIKEAVTKLDLAMAARVTVITSAPIRPLNWDKPLTATRCVGGSTGVSAPTARVLAHTCMHACHATAQITGSTAALTRRMTKGKGEPSYPLRQPSSRQHHHHELNPVTLQSSAVVYSPSS